MPGIIDFALGLSTGGFNAAIESAGGKLKGFLGEVRNFGSLSDGVMKAFQTGTGLEALHHRTGESVATLFQLNAGFQAANLSSGNVERSLHHLQRALRSVNDLGQSTHEIFQRMGLSIETRPRQNAPQPFESIANALDSLNPKAATVAANGILGSVDPSRILDLARDARQLGEEMHGAINEGQNWQSVSAAFTRSTNSLSDLKNMRSGFSTSFAAGLASPLQTGLNILNKFKATLISLGQHSGHIVKGVTEAFKEGKLGAVIDDKMKSGLGNYMAGYEEIGKVFVTAHQNSGGQALDQLNGFWAGLIGRSSNLPTSLDRTNQMPPLGAPPGPGKGSNHKIEFTALEKMGFVMGGANPALDYARRTAAATEKIAGFFGVQNQFANAQGAFTSVQGSFNAV